MARVKYLKKQDAPKEIHDCPNFHCTGSVAGMKERYYGKDALLVRSGSYIYNVTHEPWIYEMAH